MPLDHLAVRPVRQPDQLWTRRGEAVEVLEKFRAVLASRAGRDWMRGLILAWLEQRPGASGPGEIGRLARQLRGGADVAELLREADDDPAGLGLEVRAAGGRAEVVDGDPVFGERLLARLAGGEYGMEFLTTEARRRQGQRLFAYYVPHNFDGWCAFCAIGARPLVEAAHIQPASAFPQIGMDPLNGVALCGNHHRAWDAGILRWSGGGVAVGAGSGGEPERLQGLLSPLLPAPRAPRHPLRQDALMWRAGREIS